MVPHNAFADQVVATITSSGESQDAAANPNTNKIYVTTQFSDTIAVVNGSTNEIIKTLPFEYNPQGIAVNSNTNKIYATSWTSGYSSCNLNVIDGSSDTVVAYVPLGHCSESVAINPNTNMIYIGDTHCCETDYVTVVDGSTNNVAANILMPSGEAQDIAVNPATNTVYVTDVTNIITVINGTTNAIQGTIQSGETVWGIAINPKTNMIYAANPYSSTVTVIDGSSNKVVSTIHVRNYPFQIAVNPNTNKIYASGSNTVAVIDGSANAVTEYLYVGSSFPYGIGINTDTDMIYVAHQFGNYASVIDASLDTNSSLTIDSIDTNGKSITPGFHDFLFQFGAVSSSGFMPNAFTLGSTQPYTITAQDYGNYTFDHWAYTGSKMRDRFVSISSGTQLTAVYSQIDNSPSSNQAKISVSSSDSGGNPIGGYYTTLWKNCSNQMQFGNCVLQAYWYTPTTFFVNAAETYQIAVADYGNYVFDHWSDGITNRFYGITPGNGTVTNLVAVYRNTSASETAPSAPQNLAATVSTPSEVDLSWTQPSSSGGSPITGYKLERSTDGGTSWSAIVPNTGSASTKYNDTGLSPGTAYAYQASAINSVGTSVPSNSASATTPSTVPGAPTSLTATAVSSSQINLSWAAPASNGGSQVTGYVIQRSTDGGSTWSTIVSDSGSTSTAYSDTGLAASTTYAYQVSAINSVGNSLPSNTAYATTSGVVIASRIVLNNVQSTSGTTSASNQITLSGFNAGTGSNQLLLVGISANNNSPVSVTFNGVQLTQVVMSFYNNDAEFWYLKNPTGTGDITVTMGGPTQAVVGAYSLSGVNQTAPIPTHVAKHNTTPNSPNISITTKYANDLVLDLPSIYGGSTLGSPTCTQQWDTNVQNAITGASSSTMVQSPATVTCKWSASSADFWDDVAVDLKAAS